MLRFPIFVLPVCFAVLLLGCSSGDDDDGSSQAVLDSEQTSPAPDSNSDALADGPIPVEPDGGIGGTPNDGPLAGTSWVWQQNEQFTLEFIDNEMIAGQLGCNSFFTTYTANQTGDNAGELRLSPQLGSTLIACDDVSAEQQQLYTGMLRAIESYQRNGDILRVTGGPLSTTFRSK